MRVVWLLEGEIVHLNWDSFKNVWRTNTSMFTNAGIIPKHCWEKLLPCVKYALIITMLFFSTEVFVFLKLAAVPLQPSAVIQLRRLHRADPCVECPRGTEALSSLCVMDGTKRFLPSPWVTAAPCRCAGVRASKIVGHACRRNPSICLSGRLCQAR